MFCKKCGKELSENTTFCTKCGTSTTETASATETINNYNPVPEKKKPSIVKKIIITIIFFIIATAAVDVLIDQFSNQELTKEEEQEIENIFQDVITGSNTADPSSQDVVDFMNEALDYFKAEAASNNEAVNHLIALPYLEISSYTSKEQMTEILDAIDEVITTSLDLQERGPIIKQNARQIIIDGFNDDTGREAALEGFDEYADHPDTIELREKVFSSSLKYYNLLRDHYQFMIDNIDDYDIAFDTTIQEDNIYFETNTILNEYNDFIVEINVLAVDVAENAELLYSTVNSLLSEDGVPVTIEEIEKRIFETE